MQAHAGKEFLKKIDDLTVCIIAFVMLGMELQILAGEYLKSYLLGLVYIKKLVLGYLDLSFLKDGFGEFLGSAYVLSFTPAKSVIIDIPVFAFLEYAHWLPFPDPELL